MNQRIPASTCGKVGELGWVWPRHDMIEIEHDLDDTPAPDCGCPLCVLAHGDREHLAELLLERA